jgi:hypothetical protein
MAEARGRFEWEQTAKILALIHNTHYKEPVKASHYNPYMRDAKLTGEAGMAMLELALNDDRRAGNNPVQQAPRDAGAVPGPG